MAEIRLPNKEWGEPLERLQRGIVRLPGSRAQSLSLAVQDCCRFYGFLSAIWQRLTIDYALYNDYISIATKRMEDSEKGPFFTNEDDSILLRRMQETTYLRIDYYDFLIYSRILMDKLAYLARLFHESKLPSSFHKQKDFLVRLENVPFKPDEEYADHVRKKTDWFDRSLKLPRDKLIVHGLPFMEGIKSSSRGNITLLRLGWGRDLQKSWQTLKKLKSKYECKYPELKKINDNIFEITKFLIDRPEIVFEPDDRTVFSECLGVAGSELPDIGLLADQIIAFTDFFGKHFEKRLSQY